MSFPSRLATLDDRPAILELIERSARELCRCDYSDAQIEAALGTAWGVDSQLIVDQTYFVVEEASALVAAGGWSFRATLFGSDARSDRAPERLVAGRDAARVRAFFVAPSHARRGIGRALMERCEREIVRHGYRAAELAATLPGERLYRALGYAAMGPLRHPLGAGAFIDFVSMRKELV